MKLLIMQFCQLFYYVIFLSCMCLLDCGAV